jgi:hypothetical protein
VNDLCVSATSIELSATPSGGIFTGLGVTGTSFDPNKAGVGIHTITYTVTGNCSGQQQIQIKVLPLPNIQITTVPDLCLNDGAVILTANPSGGVFRAMVSMAIHLLLIKLEHLKFFIPIQTHLDAPIIQK